MERISLEKLKNEYPTAYEFITTHNMNTIAEKRYDLGNKIYVNIESYSTFQFGERKYESHVQYIDIQYIISGRENIVVAPIDKLTIVEPYDSDRDIAFYNNEFRGNDNIMSAGDMLVLKPEDGHMPCIAICGPTYVKKAVFKIPVKKI